MIMCNARRRARRGLAYFVSKSVLIGAAALNVLAFPIAYAGTTGATGYTYDELGRVRSVTYSNGSTVNYTYDPAGNRTQVVHFNNNHNPIANADSVSTASGSAITLDPRTNDSDPDGDALTITAVGSASHGSVAFTGASVTYTPVGGYNGSDSFTYTISDGRGGSASATVTVTVGNPTVTINITSASNLRTLANNAGYTGASGAQYQFVVPAGTTVMGASGGNAAISTGTWPSGVTLTLVVNGNVYGGGGTGGAGGGVASNGSPGGNGGDAVSAQSPITVTVNSGGAIVAGGGGGGGGGYFSTSNQGGSVSNGGGGGGGGFPDGAGGAGGGYNSSYTITGSGSNGNTGTTTGGGAGGGGGGSNGGGGYNETGGAGGGQAASGVSGHTQSATYTGGAGGTPGYAIRKNGNSVTVSNSGTIAGTQG